jgi:hypothetical protein
MNKKKTQKLKEVNKLRKTLITVFLVFLSVVLIYGYADAVSGPCSSCHTMHNSQDGTWQASDDDGTLSATANEHLTKSTCLGCHNGAVDAPNIFGTTQRTAGGTFAPSVVDTTTGDNSKVHNVRDIAWTFDEIALLNLTPGEEPQGSYDPPNRSRRADLRGKQRLPRRSYQKWKRCRNQGLSSCIQSGISFSRVLRWLCY